MRELSETLKGTSHDKTKKCNLTASRCILVRGVFDIHNERGVAEVSTSISTLFWGPITHLPPVFASSISPPIILRVHLPPVPFPHRPPMFLRQASQIPNFLGPTSHLIVLCLCLCFFCYISCTIYTLVHTIILCVLSRFLRYRFCVGYYLILMLDTEVFWCNY